MILHEIGYLILGGAFQCWFLNAENPCPNAEKIKPAGISRESVSEFDIQEVHYEESGFAVFERTNNQFIIRKKTGEKISLKLSEINSQAEKALPKTPHASDGQQLLWHYEPLEDIFKNAMIAHEGDYLSLLKKEDLKTSLVISKDQLENIRQKRIEKLLKQNQFSLPIGHIVTSVPCTYKKINANTSSGTCAAPGKALAYSKPDRNSEKILDASLLWANLEGLHVQKNIANPPESSDELFVYEEKGDWIRMKLVVLDKSKRVVWFNKKDIPYKLVHLNEADRVKSLVRFLKSSNMSSSTHLNLAENLILLNEQPLDLDLDSAGETKWFDGILWIKVNVRSEPHCSVDEAITISTGWLPYINPITKKKVLSWFSRGC